MTQAEYETLCKKLKQPIANKQVESPIQVEKKPKMSKTEMEYERIYLRDRLHKFEGITLKMSNGHRYTPDFFVWGEEYDDGLECHEVKGAFRLGSYGRAKLAFDQCRAEYPMFRFVWSTKTKDGWVIRKGEL